MSKKGENFYEILGVRNDSSQDEIKKRYRKLAVELHPDKNNGDSKSEEKFKAVSHAYEVLSDEKKRAAYDDQLRYGSTRPEAGNAQGRTDFSDIFSGNTDDLFQTIFGFGGNDGSIGRDLQSSLEISFRDMALGAEITVDLGNGKGQEGKVTLHIPSGINSGSKIKLPGRGQPGKKRAGDLYIAIMVEEHPVFHRSGIDLVIVLPTSITEAMLGATIKVPTLTGNEVKVKIKAGAQYGDKLRIRGEGIKAGKQQGDLIIILQPQTPTKLSKESIKLTELLAKELNKEEIRSNFYKQAKL
jgi:molecular chaperone DnaJ